MTKLTNLGGFREDRERDKDLQAMRKKKEDTSPTFRFSGMMNVKERTTL